MGLGAVSAALFENIPFLLTLAKHKLMVFVASALILTLGGWLLYRPGRHCPADSALAAKCASAHRWNIRIWWLSVVLWVIGFFAAYLSLFFYRLFVQI